MNRRALALASLWVWSSLCALPPRVVGADDPSIAWVRHPTTSLEAVEGDISQTILAGRYLAGMAVVERSLSDASARPHPVAPQFHVSTDPCYDSINPRLLFAGKESPDSPFQIWQSTPEAAEPRLLFQSDTDCVQPLAMPDGAVVFVSVARGEFDEHGGTRALSLFSWSPGEREPSRITFGPSSEFDPAILPDGRLVFSSWQHVGAHWPRGNTALLLVNSDGTGLFPYHGSHTGQWLKRGATPGLAGRVLHIESDRMRGVGAGQLVVTHRNDSFAASVPLTATVGYEVADVVVLGEQQWIVSARKLHTDSPFGLYSCVGEDLVPLLKSDTENALAPTVSEPVFVPDLRFSTVVPGTEYGYLLILDIYETDREPIPGSAPPPYAAVRVIEGMTQTTPGIESNRFLSVQGREDEPLLEPRSATGILPARILGEVPPAEDGSVYLKLPADRPLRIQLIDDEGFAAVNERSWFWVRPNERRVCIGCHEDRELSPLNRAALAAAREPTDLTRSERWQEVSFMQDIRPIIRETCAVASCHMPPSPTASMNLSSSVCASDTEPFLSRHFEPAYANLLARQRDKSFAVGGRRVHVGSARQSPLLWMLYGRALAPQYTPAPFERPMLTPHPGPMLSAQSLDLFRKWIDLGAAYGGSGSWPVSASTSLSHQTE